MVNIISDKDIIEQSEIIFLRDREWSIIDGEICRVTDFIPSDFIKDRKALALRKTLPYASVNLECKILPTKITGFICHKIDFMHLWMAFKERSIKQDEEVLIIWTKRNYKNIYKFFTAFMPRIWVMICHKDAFELSVNQRYKPELSGEARWNANKPIIQWKPEVMK